MSEALIYFIRLGDESIAIGFGLTPASPSEGEASQSKLTFPYNPGDTADIHGGRNHKPRSAPLHPIAENFTAVSSHPFARHLSHFADLRSPSVTILGQMEISSVPHPLPLPLPSSAVYSLFTRARAARAEIPHVHI